MPTFYLLRVLELVSSFSAGDLLVRAGEWDPRTQDEPLPYQDRAVNSIIRHLSHRADTLYHDVALLALQEPFVQADNVGVVCLPGPGARFNLVNCVASGWGQDKLGTQETFQTPLKKVELPIVPHDECQKKLRTTRLSPFFKLHGSFICAGGESGRDTCQVGRAVARYGTVYLRRWGEWQRRLPGIVLFIWTVEDSGGDTCQVGRVAERDTCQVWYCLSVQVGRVAERDTCQVLYCLSAQVGRVAETPVRYGTVYLCRWGEWQRETDTCQGDGGGPLVCPLSDVTGRYVQVGVVSWGIGCGDTQVPAVYSNVARYTQWIGEQLQLMELKLQSSVQLYDEGFTSAVKFVNDSTELSRARDQREPPLPALTTDPDLRRSGFLTSGFPTLYCTKV
uniref:Peptidase S1 domain-containing protein n=1 Tax=Timema shepardi TaxID=629360 RepID=A0A7R9B7U0_TIMSH|nr:unnamed protein product [Timema shepardi]